MTMYVITQETIQRKAVVLFVLHTGNISWQQWVADMATHLRVNVPLPSSSSTVPVLLPDPNVAINMIMQQQSQMLASIDRLSQAMTAQARQPQQFPPVPPSDVLMMQEQEAHLENLEQLISAVNQGTFQEAAEEEVVQPPIKKQKTLGQDNVFRLMVLLLEWLESHFSWIAF